MERVPSFGGPWVNWVMAWIAHNVKISDIRDDNTAMQWDCNKQTQMEERRAGEAWRDKKWEHLGGWVANKLPAAALKVILIISRHFSPSAPPYKCTAGREGPKEGWTERRLLYARDQRDGGWGGCSTSSWHDFPSAALVMSLATLCLSALPTNWMSRTTVRRSVQSEKYKISCF